MIDRELRATIQPWHSGCFRAVSDRLTSVAVFREDYILRLIKQLVDFVAKLAGLRQAGRFDEAIDEAGKGWDELLGHPRTIVEITDTPMLAALLGEPARMRVAARLLIEEGHARAGKGDPVHAAVCYRRAFELYLEARAAAPEADDDAAITELGRLVPVSQLDARYRSESE